MSQAAEPKPRRLESLLALAAVLYFYSGVDTYLVGIGGPNPTNALLAFAAIVTAAIVIEPHEVRPSLRSPLVLWLLFYFGMTIAWVPFIKGYEDVWQVALYRCRSILTLFAFVFILDSPRAQRTAIVAVAICIVLGSALNVAELLSLVRFETAIERVPGRSSGFYADPNGAAQCIILGLALVIDRIPASFRMPLFIVSVFGVVTTFSRQGFVCLALLFIWMMRRRTLKPITIALGAAFVVLMLALALGLTSSNELLTENTASRLRLGGDDSGRLGLALKAWRMFLSSPWVGNGLGATHTWDEDQFAHNMFVTYAADQGILGLLTFPALGAAVLWKNRGATGFVVLLMTFGFFSHTLLDGRDVSFLIALAASRPLFGAVMSTGSLEDCGAVPQAPGAT